MGKDYIDILEMILIETKITYKVSYIIVKLHYFVEKVHNSNKVYQGHNSKASLGE